MSTGLIRRFIRTAEAVIEVRTDQVHLLEAALAAAVRRAFVTIRASDPHRHIFRPLARRLESTGGARALDMHATSAVVLG